jgi:3-phenylpropionate/trans-cinnamate dioxygenase ferredoxin reductase component
MSQAFVVVGGGLAGGKAVETLREEGFTGPVVLVTAEEELPYERPPLSKGYLLGKEPRDQAYVHDRDWYDQRSVELRLGTRVVAIDRSAQEVEVDGGGRLAYERLLLATGSAVRRLDVPGAGLDGVLYLRELRDADRIRTVLEGRGRVAVVGGGWIGLEVAAAARTYGCDVTLLEAAPLPLLGVLGEEVGRVFADLHREHGVDLLLSTGVAELVGEGGRVTGLVTDGDRRVAADAVVVGIGVRPLTDLADSAGLEVDDGVLVDQSLRTSDPSIFAAGDVANAYNPLLGRRVRVEHWANALHGGPAAARAMLGQDVVYDRLPYFFSDQYDLGMEYVGQPAPGEVDRVVLRGDVAGRAFQAFWLSGGRIVAGMHANLWDEGIDPVKALVAERVEVDPDRLTDAGVPLAEVVA